jgi:hypothetical protein
VQQDQTGAAPEAAAPVDAPPSSGVQQDQTGAAPAEDQQQQPQQQQLVESKSQTRLKAEQMQEPKVPAKLLVQTNITNNCKPKSFCSDIKNEDLFVRIFTFEGNQLRNETLPSSIPSNSRGWSVDLFPPRTEGLQYHVVQDNRADYPNAILVNTTFSEDCHGIIEQKETKKCMITNNVTANNMPAMIRVFTKVENHCQPKLPCLSIKDEDFMATISTFEYNTMRQKVKPFPGNSHGWTVHLFPDRLSVTQLPPYGKGIEYKVQQNIEDESKFEGVSTNTTYSANCSSTIDLGSIKDCTITNYLSGPATDDISPAATDGQSLVLE